MHGTTIKKIIMRELYIQSVEIIDFSDILISYVHWN
jgi:hypothetical protein